MDNDNLMHIFVKLSIKSKTNWQSWHSIVNKPFLVSRSERSRDSGSHNVCLSVCMSQTLIRFKSIDSSVNSFIEWQNWLDITESD